VWAQEEGENTTTGTIQGKLIDDVGAPVEAAKVLYSSSETDTRGVVRSGADGRYVSEQLPPGHYLVRIEGRDMIPVEGTVAVAAGRSVTADFKLDWIVPGPVEVQSKFGGDVVNTFPINGRDYLSPSRIEPGIQTIDAGALDQGKSGMQTVSIGGNSGRTTHYDADEVEIMDETRGVATENFPAEAVREVTITRVSPALFQSLNATGSVRVSTRSGGDELHGNLYGNLRDQFLGLAGFPGGPSDYSRQQYGFGAGGAVIKDRGFLFVGGERTKQDGFLPLITPDLILPNAANLNAFDETTLQSAYLRENLLAARFDYNFSEDTKGFARVNYDNFNGVGPTSSFSDFRNQMNVPSLALGLDWNRGKFTNSARFGFQKMVDALNPASGGASGVPAYPFDLQIGQFAAGPNGVGPRQTIQRDLYGRYDTSTRYRVLHTIRFGGAIHRITQGDFYYQGVDGPSITSSDGIATIDAVNGNSLLTPLYPGDPRGAADNPLNYPVGTLAIYNGLANFSEKSVFGRPNGGHFDTRFEGYIGDTYNVIPNLNVSVGVNYVLDTGRTNGDIAPIPCSAINTAIVLSPPCTTGYILDQFDLLGLENQPAFRSIGRRVTTPDHNFSPQAGLAWDPGHNGRTVVRASGGMFFDNFLMQNSYQDRINRLSNGQFNRSLNVCPAGAVLFPDGSLVSSVDGLDIASQICGQPIGSVSTAIQDLQAEFINTQKAVASGPNIYSLANSIANFGGMISPNYKTPRLVHMAAGMQRQIGERGTFSVDAIREIGTQFPMGIDTNHVGGAAYLTDGDNPNPILNNYAAELSAINATLAANPASAGCPLATFTGASSQTAIDCYLANVPTASITDFARHGLDSSNAYCGPFPCSVLGKRQAAFGGVNPQVGSNVMYFPSGHSKYDALQLSYHGVTGLNTARRVQRLDIQISYTLSRYRSNIVQADGASGDFSILTPAPDNNPHKYWGDSGFDRTHQFLLAPTADLPHGFRLSTIMHFASPLPLTAMIPQADGGGIPGEIFRSDITGDGTVGDVLTGTSIGSVGKYSAENVTRAINYYNANVGGKLTPAGGALVSSQLFRSDQLFNLGAVAPFILGPPGHYGESLWLKTTDVRLTRPIQVSEHVNVEPVVSIFNVFNWANFGGPGHQLSGIMDGAPGSSLNNESWAGLCGNSTSYCTSRTDRILPGSGTYSEGAPRQFEFGVRISF
jgi:hypothetical protein